MTVSGIRKEAVTGLKDDINNFKIGLKFDYKTAKKNTHYYTEQTPFTFTDVDGNTFTCTDEYGIVLAPTTYTLGLSDDYEKLLNYLGDLQNE